jgi:hypothetical protein
MGAIPDSRKEMDTDQVQTFIVWWVIRCVSCLRFSLVWTMNAGKKCSVSSLDFIWSFRQTPFRIGFIRYFFGHMALKDVWLSCHRIRTKSDHQIPDKRICRHSRNSHDTKCSVQWASLRLAHDPLLSTRDATRLRRPPWCASVRKTSARLYRHKDRVHIKEGAFCASTFNRPCPEHGSSNRVASFARKAGIQIWSSSMSVAPVDRRIESKTQGTHGANDSLLRSGEKRRLEKSGDGWWVLVFPSL